MQAQAILEVAMLGRLIQDLLYLQSLHSGCNVSDLQKVSNLILSSSDTRVTSSGAPSILMKVADALKKSVEAISESVTSCFAAIEKLSRLLTQHAEKNGAIALELQRKPRCQELSIEKHLLSRIQEELAKRAEFIARNRGIINSAPQNNRPFSAVVDILKSSAAAELEVLAASTSNGHHEASYLGEYAGDTIAALREEVRVLNRGMQVMAGQLHQFQQQQQQQQPSFHKPTLNRSNYLAPARPQIIPIEQNAREGDGFKLTGVQPHGTLSIRELLPECKENAQADHTKDRALRFVLFLVFLHLEHFFHPQLVVSFNPCL